MSDRAYSIMAWVLGALVGLVGILVLMVIMLVARHLFTTPSAGNMEQAFHTCEASRIGSASEEECGRLQDKYNVEYVCFERSAKVSNVCWIEYPKREYH